MPCFLSAKENCLSNSIEEREAEMRRYAACRDGLCQDTVSEERNILVMSNLKSEY